MTLRSSCPRTDRSPSCRLTGSASVLLCFLFWLVCLCSDPGTVSKDNVAAWLARHPPDDGLFLAKQCTTCKHDRPARSKHCSICGVCVARHDHHCAWVHNCVGAGNMRWFLAFLASNAVMLSYGCMLALATMYGLTLKYNMGAWLVAHPQTGATHLPLCMFCT